MTDDGPTVSGVLLPADRAVSLRVVVFVIALALLAFVTQGFVWFSATLLDGLGPSGEGIALFLCGVAVVAAALNGYANDDLLVSVLVSAAPLVGFAAFTLAVAALGTVSGPGSATRTALIRGGLTLPLGSLLGLLGVWLGRRSGGGREPPMPD
ncbi:hypothetical protein [Haloplanus aerogenes]|uniref:Uncharacterized protein n=1 Tax=Haloplanus aerogenes TaxID=660522 RepID=A0A3M0DWT5_9EURY|nr:hypothetical protein [Haloplanus aerogenes]AZH24506.1 hypothetical protein DU502_03510 [Haloplanus aerogenes]RMB23846.1 hypothetical protein ATH50_1076 [Haloplanus aerogenes]